MKKYFVFAAAAIAALASCSKVEPVTENGPAISFQAANYLNATKAHEHAQYEYTADAFGVYAWYTPTNWATDKGTNPFMKAASGNAGLEIKYTGNTSNTWAPNETYYWPKNGSLSFVGYYPQDATGAHSIITDAKPAVGFTNYVVTASAADQKTVSDVEKSDKNDLLVADAIINQTSNNDDDQHYRNGVAMVFHHILAKVRVKAVLSNDKYNPYWYAASIDAIEVNNINNTATYDGSDWSTHTAAATAGTAVSGTIGSITNLKVYNESATDKNFEQVGSDYYVMPQNLHNDAVLKVTYSIKTYSNSEKTTQVGDAVQYTKEIQLNDMSADAVSAWAKNHIYTYKITIKPISGEVLFDPCVAEDWTTADGGEKTVDPSDSTPVNNS